MSDRRPAIASRNAPAQTYRQFTATYSVARKIREFARDQVILALSLTRQIPKNGSWIRFPYYHHVFDDERGSFKKQLQFLRNCGDFISLDDAVAIAENDAKVDGRYFCITFDDGLKNCVTNALPILLEHNAPAAFFVVTRFIGTSPEKDRELTQSFFDDHEVTVEFMTWDDCRTLSRAGMTVGSHTVSHRVLSSLSPEEVERELRESKVRIEAELGIECRHFCAPVGTPDRDFIVNRDPQIASRLGYKSFLTTQRGSASRPLRPHFIERDHVLPSWDAYQLRYFFSR